MTAAETGPATQPPRVCHPRWSRHFWVAEVAAFAVILTIFLLLQYSEEGHMRHEGIRVTATVDELPLGHDGCRRCPLLFMIDEEPHYVDESLVADDDRRYVPGETIDIYVDPNDLTHVIEVDAIQQNITLGLIGIFIAGVFTIAWPIYESRRLIPK